MAHDFKNFPELTNNQMQFYYWESPHKQVTESFWGKVVKTTDGDTIHVKWAEREKPVVIRLLDTAAPERKEKGGEESRNWLESQIMGEDIEVIIDPKERVGKWGRILGTIFHGGFNINEESIRTGHAVTWDERKQASIPDFNKELEGMLKWD